MNDPFAFKEMLAIFALFSAAMVVGGGLGFVVLMRHPVEVDSFEDWMTEFEALVLDACVQMSVTRLRSIRSAPDFIVDEQAERAA